MRMKHILLLHPSLPVSLTLEKRLMIMENGCKTWKYATPSTEAEIDEKRLFISPSLVCLLCN